MNDRQDKPSILAVDDTPENLDVIKGILGNDYIIKAATNGPVALKIAESQPVEIILLDIMMPGMDGYEVCQRLKENPKTKDIPVLFVTAKGKEMDEAKGFELGAVDYITKPVIPSILKARVETHLALYDQNRVLEKKVTERTQELQSSRMEIIQRLGRAGEYRDNETGLHVIRVSKYCKILALAYGLSEEHADYIMQASTMHDVGKIGISDNILLKPGKLTAEEYDIIKTHCRIGAEILDGSTSELMKIAQSIALYHHEKWDGTGYPDGLKGEAIPIEGRIVAICDVFDTLSSSRSYKVPWSLEKVKVFINEQSGIHFDPQLVISFNSVAPELLEILDMHQD